MEATPGAADSDARTWRVRRIFSVPVLYYPIDPNLCLSFLWPEDFLDNIVAMLEKNSDKGLRLPGEWSGTSILLVCE